MHGPYFDAEERKALVDAREIFHVAREPVECFHYKHIELSLPRMLHHPHKAIAAKHGCTRAGTVVVGGDDGDAEPLSVGSAKGDLVVDRPVPLQFGREPRVNRCSGLHACPVCRLLPHGRA
jgi:hypothetical protein